MVLLRQQLSGGRQEDLHQVRHLGDDAEGAEGRLLADVGVGGLDEPFDLAGQVSRHLGGGDGAQRTQGQTNHELGAAVEVTVHARGDGRHIETGVLLGTEQRNISTKYDFDGVPTY